MTAVYASVVSFHTNPYTCGVARFNQALAKSLQVPIESVLQFEANQETISLLSLKFDEIPVVLSEQLLKNLDHLSAAFDLFLHGINHTDIESKYIAKARRVIVASREYADLIQSQRSDVIALFAPGVGVSGLRSTFDITLLTFGMAHKIRSDGYRKLGAMLKTDSRTFQLEISTALHDGTSFSEDFFSVGSEIGEVFEGNVSFLGFLADDEVSRRLTQADALVAFFPSGARENNTTVLSAMAHGSAVITNLDEYSPLWMKHGESVFDVNQLASFPSSAELSIVRTGAKKAVSPYTFEELSKLLSKREK
jgi:glycosyltransferase involved in cell wall biosynthesis